MNHIELFKQTYHRLPSTVAFTPYRICPLGAHLDHQLGAITGFAIDKGIHIAYGPKENGVIEIFSAQFEGRAQWHVNSVPPRPEGDWADHLRGATIALSLRHPLHMGICAVVDGELPIGGLSSSAAVIITFLSALSQMNGISLTESELIELSLEAENKYVGVRCGKLDQCCEIYSKKNHLLHMDMCTGEHKLIAVSPNMKPYKIAIFFSGLERTLASSKYNTRVDEAKSAAHALLVYSGNKYGIFRDTYLSDVSREVWEEYGHLLPEAWYKRAAHYFSESERVVLGVKAWERGDIEEFGRLVFESGKSSIELWETGSPELKTLYEIMTETDGIYGGRFSGAGFKGCCMALIDPEREKKIFERVEYEYIKTYPNLRGKFSAHICSTADGVKFNSEFAAKAGRME